jgi:hypothetical protein
MQNHLELAKGCAHCGRDVAGVTAVFAGKPAICGRSDCLFWAMTLVVEPVRLKRRPAPSRFRRAWAATAAGVAERVPEAA